MKKLTINVTDEQNDEMDRRSQELGVTKNGIICLAIDEWLHQRKKREQEIQR